MDTCALLLLWGKSSQESPEQCHPLLFHMPDAAPAFEALVPSSGASIPPLAAWTIYVADLHDAGEGDARCL